MRGLCKCRESGEDAVDETANAHAAMTPKETQPSPKGSSSGLTGKGGALSRYAKSSRTGRPAKVEAEIAAEHVPHPMYELNRHRIVESQLLADACDHLLHGRPTAGSPGA